MNAVIIGADRLGNIPDALSALGIRVVEHISGRQASHQRRASAIPCNTDLMILFTDFISHNVMKSFREVAQKEGVPVLACRRSVSCLVKSLAGLGIHGRQDACAACPSRAGAPVPAARVIPFNPSRR